MSSTSQNCQAVFLIDTFSEDDLEISIHYSRTLTLSIFRILGHLSADLPQNTKQKKTKHNLLKWGYIFFDSRLHSLKVEKYSFKEFKLKYFEEFERELLKRIKIVQKNVDAKSSSRKVSKMSPSDCLTRSLTDLTQDFAWETPDLFSPVKRRKIHPKKGSLSLDTEHVQACGNYVFMFTKCPKSAASLRQFAKKKVLDSDVFLDSLMPTSLRAKFCDGLKLKLVWIDTDFKVHDNSFDIQSLKLVEDAIEKINGKVIPIDAVIQYGKQPLSCLSVQNIGIEKDEIEEQGKKKEFTNAILPFTTVFEFYFSRNSKQHLASCKGSSHQGILMYNGLQLCQLDIQVLQKTHKRDTIRRSSDGPESCVSLNLPSVDGDITVQYNKLNLLQNLSVLEVYSTLHHSSSLSSHNEELFICVGTSTDSCKSLRSSMFQNIISQLLNGKFDLVLLVKDLSKFFLLKPLTSVSATLTPVSTEVILEVEKQLVKKKDETFEAEDIEIPVKTNVKDWQGLMSKLCTSKVPNFKQEKNTDEKKNSIGGVFNPKCVDKTHLPGCRAPFITLIDKLNERISQLEFLSDSEVKTLRQLQKNYHIESRPPKLIDHTPQRTGLDVTQDNDKFNIHLDDNLLKDDKRKDSVPSRGQMILTRSKQAVKEKEEEPIKQTEGVTVKSKPVVDTPTNVDFKDENELKQYLCTMYDRNVNEDCSSLYAAVQPLVTITLYYMRESGKDNPQEACEQLLKSGIILSPESLREKHLNEDDIQMKIREYQLQIVLRLEVQSMIHGGDQNASLLEDKVEEIVTLLRTISFITEPKLLSEFMKNSLVENFIHNLPQMLGSIYDELMQPYPSELESILSPDQSAGDSSVFNQSLQSCGGDVSLSQPPSNVSDVLIDRAERKSSRSRKLIHHPSLADFGPKRQIVVATKSGKEKDQKTSTKHKRKEKDREKRKLERRQSVAVMETVKNSAKKRNKASHILKSPKYMKSSNRKLVSETPSHKQKGQNMWKRLEKERRRTQSVIDIKVVAESPVKLDVVEKQSPSEKKQATRRSFYSAGPVNRSRSLTNSLELADRIAGRTSNFVKKAKRQSLFNLKSPDRNSSFLLSQLMSSPGSVRKTPGKKLSLSKALQSPCQNTRSKTPSKALSSQKSLFNEKSPKRSIKKLSFTPVKMPSQEVLIPDSPCLNTRSHTPSKGQRVTGTPSRSLTTNTLLMSPSQNTRSKITSTPTRHSVKAKLFMKSPENKTGCKTPVKFASLGEPQRGKRALNLNDVEIEANDAIVVLNNQNLEATDQSAYQIGNKSVKINIQPQTEKTPSPTKRMVVKTPSSIDSWPRKKKWTKIKYSESPKLKIDEQNIVEENGSLKSSQSNGSSSGDDEVGIRINDKLDTDDRLQLDLNNEKSEDFMFCKPRTSSKRSLAVSPEGKSYDSPAKRRCFSPLKNNMKKQNLISGTLDDGEKILLKTFGKRNLSISPEKLLSSPNKRQRISLKSIESPKQGFSLHSQLLSKNFSNTSDVLSSQGFDTNLLSSQGSVMSQDFLSLTSTDSMDYFSASNDEVFLSPTRRSRNLASSQSQETESAKLTDLSNISFVRTDSPVFGSSKKKKLEKRLKSLEIVGEQDVEDGIKTIKSPCSKVLKSEDGSSKISPSSRKYSPSVSAKSLCHLISSPILNSPATREGKEDGSPKIDQDSLNIRRQKMSGRIRRSLMQN